MIDFMSSDSDLAAISHSVSTMLNMLYDSFPFWCLHVFFELHLLDLDFILT
jgi:hypothetical protein